MLCIFFNKFCNNNNAKISGNPAIPTLTSYDLKKFKQKKTTNNNIPQVHHTQLHVLKETFIIIIIRIIH